MAALKAMPEWSTAEWASVIATAFAALAATASWVSILFDRRAQREARRPNLSAGFAVPPSQIARIVVANGGPGLAVGVGYFGVHRDASTEFKYGGVLGNGFLFPGSPNEVTVGKVANRGGTEEFVWLCSDTDNNEHVWAYDGRYKRIRAKDFLSHKAPQNLGAYFTLMYPNISIPDQGPDT